MKIAIISGGIDSLALFKFLSKYDHEYLVYFDSLHAPYGEKTPESAMCFVEKGIQRAKENGAEKIILPPVYELKYLSLSKKEEDKNLILPLFSSYLLNEVFPFSLVGKFGLFGEVPLLQEAQSLINNLSKQYALTQSQQDTKRFSFPFNFRSKDTTIFSHLLQKLGWKSLLVNTIIKNDLRYFKDAAVDSLIPLNYSYFHAETTITKFLNFKKIKFHRLSCLDNQFKKLVENQNTAPYRVKIHATDTKYPLELNKRMVWILQRGRVIDLERF